MKVSDNLFPKVQFDSTAAVPATPAAGTIAAYAKADRALYYKGSDGVEHTMSGLTWINVRAAAYGATGDGTTDDTAAFNSAVAAVNSSARGAVLYVPAGDYLTSGGFAFTKPVRLVGDGAADCFGNNAITQIRCSSATAHLFDFQSNGWSVEDMHCKNTAATAPTNGSAIHATAGDGHRIRAVTAEGFWNNFWVENGAEWYWSTCFSYSPVNYGALIRNTGLPDGGDQSIVGCQFIAKTYAALAGIQYESGGGLKIVNCKINERSGGQFSVGLNVMIPSTAATSDLLVANCSIENVSAQPIKIRNVSGGTLFNIVINGLQLARYGGAYSGIDIAAAATGQLDRVMISGVVFGQTFTSSAAAISITNVDNVHVGPCVSASHPTLLALSGVTTLRNDNARLGVVALTDGATITPDMANADNFTVTLAGNRTLANPTNPTSGQVVNIRVHQDATGTRTLAFGTKYRFPGGTAPVLSTAAGAIDLLSFQYDGTDDSFFLVANKAFA